MCLKICHVLKCFKIKGHVDAEENKTVVMIHAEDRKEEEMVSEPSVEKMVPPMPAKRSSIKQKADKSDDILLERGPQKSPKKPAASSNFVAVRPAASEPVSKKFTITSFEESATDYSGLDKPDLATQTN